MLRQKGQRAVVLGAGVAGLLVTKVLADAGFEVVTLRGGPASVDPRAGQLHNLLGRAQDHLCQLLPGFREHFDSLGGQRARVASQTYVYELGRVMPSRDLELELWSASKATIDRAIARAARLQREVRDERATGLVLEGRRAIGVRTSTGVIDADVIVDAMGARSPLAGWLDSPPPVVERRGRQWYCTMRFRLDRPDEPRFWMVFPTYPHTRGGLASPLGGGAWNVSVSGGSPDAAPTTATAFIEYARSLEDGSIGSLIDGGRPEGVPVRFTKPVARWRRYDRTDRLPTGILPVGDALADVEPLFGQGISVAAWQAATLHSILKDGDDVMSLSSRYLRRSAEIVDTAWRLTSLFDPGSLDNLSDPEWGELCDALPRDAELHRSYVEVWHLLRPASDLRALARRARQVLAS